MKRRRFLQIGALPAFACFPIFSADENVRKKGDYAPGRIPNEYSLFLSGEREALSNGPKVWVIEAGTVSLAGSGEVLKPGQAANGWLLMAVVPMNGSNTAVFEKQVSHQGSIVYITQEGGVILRIRKGIGSLSNVRPRPINAPQIRFVRASPYEPGPDRLAQYVLTSNEDPCYENVAALGAEYVGWTLVGNETGGPLRSLFIQADGSSREISQESSGTASWAPDLAGAVLNPLDLLPDEYPEVFRYLPGYSKRTLLGGYLPVAHTGVWNPETKAGYEVMVALPPGEQAKPIGRVRATVPQWAAEADRGVHKNGGSAIVDRYWNTNAAEFWPELAGIANHWQHFFEDRMKVEIPDEWLLNAARAGITLSRCSYRGLQPTYQIGEGGYTKLPERSHALFPVAHYEFVWAHQLWNLTNEVEPYFQFYLNNYILPDGNFLYNTQDQVEAPMNVGVFLWNSARAYDYSHDAAALQNRLPVLRRMIDYVLARYEYNQRTFTPEDRRYGLIWGSPEADLGDPDNDYPNSHPYYFQNAAWIWRGLKEHARCLKRAAREHGLAELEKESERNAFISAQMRTLIERSLIATIAAGSATMRAAAITPFTPDDINREPSELKSYENHRFMMDWFTADWGDATLDAGHLKHRELAGQKIMGLHTDGNWCRTSNFMAHGTLAALIRQSDYRPFLLTLYALCCYAADSGNRYSPEDALLPGSYPGEGSKYGWSAVVNSVLQPTLGLRWLLCYEESDREICHLQKAAPKHWFAAGQRIHVEQCPTRFGMLGWTTEAASDSEWRLRVTVESGFSGQVAIHIHSPGGLPLKSSTTGSVERDRVVIEPAAFAASKTVNVIVKT